MTGSLVGLFAVWCIGWFVDLCLVCWLSNCVLVGWLPGWHAGLPTAWIPAYLSSYMPVWLVIYTFVLQFPFRLLLKQGRGLL